MALTIARLGELLAERNPRGWFVAGDPVLLTGPERMPESVLLSWRVMVGTDVAAVVTATPDGRVAEVIPAPGIAAAAVFVAEKVEEGRDADRG